MSPLSTISMVLLVPTLALSQYQPHCDSGREGQVLVHLFSWRWTDVAAECENVLGPRGFCGVQVSPPNEHVIVTEPNRPWWERYQPVSYLLESASGTRVQFIDMVERCNAVGVRIYIDAVVNHMAGVNFGTGYGTGGSYYDTRRMRFDGVPYSSSDFGELCTTSSGNIEKYDEAIQVRNCRLLGLLDLKGGSPYVRQKIAAYFNDMLDIGIDGMRIDAAKHMWPNDIKGLLELTNNTNSNKRPFVFQEVIDLYGNEPIKSTDYVHVGRVTEFKYGLRLAEVFDDAGSTSMTSLKNFGADWGMLSNDQALVFIDNHDNQRGHGGGGKILTYKDPAMYKMAVIFMLSWPYGIPRVMSSYDFDKDWTGPPSGSPGNGDSCKNGWICEHRWRQIMNMVTWRNTAGSFEVANWWSNGKNQIAFSRGSSSFIAFNKKDGMLSRSLRTGLPTGTYCDIISGDVIKGKCTGRVIDVNSDSTAYIEIDGYSENPVIAIHLDSKVNASDIVKPSYPPSSGSTQRTMVFIMKHSSPGETVFLRGGCGGTCPIPIKYVNRIGKHYDGYNSWNAGDRFLDWNGEEKGQGEDNGKAAQGSPMVWTTNDPRKSGYTIENRFGDHFWMWDVYMDCADTRNGYFEVKGYLNGEWEIDIYQKNCNDGEDSGKSYYSNSFNHIARCGYINVFEWSRSDCSMTPLN